MTRPNSWATLPSSDPVIRHCTEAIQAMRADPLHLQWLSDPELRQRSHAGLNKGEASNALRRPVFFHRQGEIRDRTFTKDSTVLACENQPDRVETDLVGVR